MPTAIDKHYDDYMFKKRFEDVVYKGLASKVGNCQTCEKELSSDDRHYHQHFSKGILCWGCATTCQSCRRGLNDPYMLGMCLMCNGPRDEIPSHWFEHLDKDDPKRVAGEVFMRIRNK